MSNHFHILLEVPDAENISDGEMVRRLGRIYDRNEVAEFKEELERYRLEGNQEMIDSLRQKYLYRMANLSEFMKTLKQRFSIWYNRNHDRRGPLWEDRFKSVLVEAAHATGGTMEGCALLTISAYIDLNPVRAGIVADPKDYRWCGVWEAASGHLDACNGLGYLLGIAEGGPPVAWNLASYRYRMHLFVEGDDVFSSKAVREVLDAGGELPLKDLLRCRVRYFNDGLVLGSRLFVNEVFRTKRDRFCSKRKNGARKMKRVRSGELCVAKDLRKTGVSIS